MTSACAGSQCGQSRSWTGVTTNGAKFDQAQVALRAKIRIELECQVPCIEFLAGTRGSNATEKKTIGTNQRHHGFRSGHAGWANLNVSAGPAAQSERGPMCGTLNSPRWSTMAAARTCIAHGRTRSSRTPPDTVAWARSRGLRTLRLRGGVIRAANTDAAIHR